MVKKLISSFLSIMFIINFILFTGVYADKGDITIGIAVEFMDHAASAYISEYQGWYKEEGLLLNSYDSYITGMALATALAQGDIQAAYICLIPAINAFSNAKIPIKIVSATHKYGYGVVVNNRIKQIQDLEKDGMKIGCIREGGAADALLHKAIIKYNLNEQKILNNIQRMDPAKQLLAIKMGKLDAAFLPEQWATMAEDSQHYMLLTSQDIWPEMLGSVLVVKTELIEEYPELVGKLVKVTERATKWINEHPEESANILAEQFSKIGQDMQLTENTLKNEDIVKISFDPEILIKSMSRLDYCTEIDEKIIQETIDFLVEIDYIKKTFPASSILDLRFL